MKMIDHVKLQVNYNYSIRLVKHKLKGNQKKS